MVQEDFQINEAYDLGRKKSDRATEDIDYNYSDDGTHEFPHRHKWDWSNPEKPKRLK